ncbi:MAG: helicase-associated domain-containing protein [Leucobacter sp.]
MSGTLPLSSHLASLDRAGLLSLASSRRIASPTTVNDPLDLAQELLKPDSISQALTLLTREELHTLDAIHRAQPVGTLHESAVASLLAHGLIAAGPTPLSEVAQTLESQLAIQGISPSELQDSLGATPLPNLTDNGAIDTGTAADTSGWFAQALTASGQVAWMLRDLGRAPAKLNRNGVVASAWVKSLVERLSIPRGAELVELVRATGLAVPVGTGFVARADAWLASEHETRWVVLAQAAITFMPKRLLDMLRAGEFAEETSQSGSKDSHPVISHVIDAFPAQFPLATPATLAAIDRAAQLWERLGITMHGHLSSGGAQVLYDSEFIPTGWPAAAPGIYVQPDLTVVIPGPLPVADESALATIAVPEQLGVASTLRITEASLGEAFDRGLDAQTIRDMLERLTVSGIPQPLDYLITALSERAGSVIVTQNFSEHGRSRIDFAQEALRNTVLVDRRLAHLQLHEPPAAPLTDTAIAPLYSKLRADHVLAALLDARYPAKTESQAHAAAEAQADRKAAEAHAFEASTEAPADPVEELVDRVLAATHASPSDIGRQVTLAIRDRSSIKVTVEIRGAVRDFTIVPVSLAAGRMRALDEIAGVERTLPLEAITAVAPVT